MKEIENINAFDKLIASRNDLDSYVFQGIDLSNYTRKLNAKKITKCLFLGCQLTPAAQGKLLENENLIFPNFKLPFKVYRGDLYSAATLYDNYNYKETSTYDQTMDKVMYDHYVAHGKGEPDTIYESLWRRLHDHAISDALYDYLEKWNPYRVVAIMGGHSLSRNSEDYYKIALISKQLSENGFLMVSGGGPGGMEATHVGSWFAHRNLEEMNEGIELLSKAPLYNDELWLSKAFEVMEKYPLESNVESIGIPTWFYGHEPPCPFATHIAKYFANSVREEGLLAIAKGGVLFAPGSAGTIQEIFQEAAQNHYETFGNVSPMVFMNTAYWTRTKPVYPILKQLSGEREYGKLVSIHDQVEAIIAQFTRFYKQSTQETSLINTEKA